MTSMNRHDPGASNEIKMCIRTTCVTVGNLFTTGTFLQTFLASGGVPGDQIGSLTATLSLVQTAVILLLSFVVDRVKGVIRKSALMLLLIPIYFLVMLPFAFSERIASGLLLKAAMGAGLWHVILNSVYIVLDYRLPYQIMDMRHYPRVIGRNGLVSGLVSVVVSTAATALLAACAVGKVMTGMYILGMGCFLLAFFAARSFSPLPSPENNALRKQKGGLLATLRLPLFWVLLLPNFMRGINDGVIGMMAAICIYEMGISPAQSSTLAIAITVVNILSSFAFMRLSSRIRMSTMCLLSGCVMGLFMPLLMAWKIFPLVMGFYIIVRFAELLIGSSIPALLMQVIPRECIGSFTSLRLGVNFGGVALGSFLAGIALGKIPVLWLFAFSGMLQFIGCLVYYLVCRKKEMPLAKG